MRTDLPAGTVTFLFTDVEGSTKLLHELGPEGYAQALAEHRRVLRDAFTLYDGVEVDTQGDAFFVAFPTAPGALEAAREATEALAEGPIRVRIGVHTGTPLVTEEGYVGADVHRAARIAAVGHGGQVLVSSAAAALVERGGLVDLGEHRLKDLSAPERIYQLGEGDFPPLSSLHSTNLPVPATPFLGRERELGELAELITRESVRLVTLTGPGGTGKTRLALQAAGQAADAFPGGVFWVPLAPLRDPALVLETAASALGGQGELAEQIGGKRLLLLFDNFEHLIEAAEALAELLRRCPQLTLLVTSREPLRLEGEWEYGVDPLREQEAVALFETRARAVKRDFAANGEVREICARLDNLPLAIELAAARAKVLSPRALLERLERRLPVLAGGARDAPERQRTLRATIEWSHELLSPEEQTLFRRLGVFRGGWTLEAAEEVCQADLDTLASLVDKSLVRVREDDRYWLLETIREYAAERLQASGEADEVRRRHAEHFLALAEAAEPNLLEGREWLERLSVDHDNLRATLDWFEMSNEGERALRLAGALTQFWKMRSHLFEGRRRLEAALAADERPTRARAKALNGAAILAVTSRDGRTARARGEEALALHRTLGDTWGVAYSGIVLGNVAAGEGDFAAAQQTLDESMRTFRELGDEHHALWAAHNLAAACHELGDLERARVLYEDNLRRARAVRDEKNEAMSLGALAGFARREGRTRDAISMLAKATLLERDLGDLIWVANNLARVASLFALMEGAVTAARLLACAETVHQELEVSWASWAAEMNEETLTAVRTQLNEAAFAEAWEEGRALTADEAVELALTAAK